MKSSRYTPEQVAFGLRQAEDGKPVSEVCRKMGVSEQTFYRWKGWAVNHKRVYRLYRQEGLMLRTKKPKRHVSCQCLLPLPCLTPNPPKVCRYSSGMGDEG